MITKKNIKKIEKRIGYKFKNKDLLKQALRHSSFANEYYQTTGVKLQDYERLEFLGDSVLELVISKYLFKKFPEYDESMLTRIRSIIVSTKILAEVSGTIDLGRMIMLSKGERLNCKEKYRGALLEDVLESLISAVYLDGGLKKSEKMILKLFKNKIDEILKQNSFTDYKTKLQEYSLKKYQSLPKYVTISETGPGHRKKFKVSVTINKKLTCEGSGNSKKAAETVAAKQILKIIEENRI